MFIVFGHAKWFELWDDILIQLSAKYKDFLFVDLSVELAIIESF